MADARALSCPFPTTPGHPEAEALTQSTLSWARAWRLLPDESARTLASVHSYSQLAARCYPTAAFSRLAAICDYYSWLFFFDDVCEDLSIDGGDPRHVVQLLSEVYGVMLLKPQAPSVDPKFQGALADIWARIATFSPPAWRTRIKPRDAHLDSRQLRMVHGHLATTKHWLVRREDSPRGGRSKVTTGALGRAATEILGPLWTSSLA